MEVPVSDGMRQNDVLRRSAIVSSYTPCTYYLELATDADYEFYQTMGNSVAVTYNYIFSILNLIEGVYEYAFNLKFIVTHQNIWTVTSNGYPYTSTNYNTLLNQFQTYWNSNNTEVPRDIAHLFTGKTIIDSNGNVIDGVALWIGAFGTSNGYSLSRYRLNMHKTVAHELGHNLNGQHPVSAIECLCDSPTEKSVMC